MANIRLDLLEVASTCAFVTQVAENQLALASKSSYSSMKAALSESKGEHIKALLLQLEEENRKAEEMKDLLSDLQKFMMRAALSLQSLDQSYAKNHIDER